MNETSDRLGLDALARSIRHVNMKNGWNVVDRYDWFYSAHKVPAALALIHSELSEALEEFRRPCGTEEEGQQGIDRCVEELADVLIRTLDLAGGLTNELDRVVLEKLRKNSSRGWRHGGKRV